MVGNWIRCYADHTSKKIWETLNLSMIECFFSNEYAGRSDLFEGLFIWREKSPDGETLPYGDKYRKLQGTYPVVSLSFAAVKEKDMSQRFRGSIRSLRTCITRTVFCWRAIVCFRKKRKISARFPTKCRRLRQPWRFTVFQDICINTITKE